MRSLEWCWKYSRILSLFHSLKKYLLESRLHIKASSEWWMGKFIQEDRDHWKGTGGIYVGVTNNLTYLSHFYKFIINSFRHHFVPNKGVRPTEKRVDGSDFAIPTNKWRCSSAIDTEGFWWAVGIYDVCKNMHSLAMLRNFSLIKSFLIG